ncbi:MAG: SDR family oxidoreductase [Myxococcota bacterium]
MSIHGPDLGAFSGPICVTGGSGFIGSHVVRRLLELGREVRCLVMAGDNAPALQGLDVVQVTGDLLDGPSLDRAMDGCELVIHLAAIYALWLPEPELMHRVNVDGTREVLRAALRAGVKRVVHTSSIAAVGCLDGTAVADEATLFDDWTTADPYVMSKVLSEREALRALYREDMEVVVVNPAFPFGARDIGPTPTGNLILSLMRGELPFVMQGGFNAVDVKDVAEGHLLAAERGRSGERYLLAGHNLSYSAFAADIARLCQVRGPLLSLPRGLLLKLGSAAERGAHILRRPPLFTRGSIAMTAGRFLYFDTTKAESELGYRPGPLEAAFTDAITWFKSPENPHNTEHITTRARQLLRL